MYGPVNVEFEDSEKLGDIRIDSINFEDTRADYPKTPAFTADREVKARLRLSRRPREEVSSVASVFNLFGSGGSDRRDTKREQVKHRIDYSAAAGRHTLVGSLFDHRGRLQDSRDAEFYVVFKSPGNVEQVARSGVLFGDKAVTRLRISNTINLNHRDPAIINAAAGLLEDVRPGKNPVLFTRHPNGATDPRAAAEIMALTLDPKLVWYNAGDSDFSSDLDILSVGYGDCTDMTALYVSLSRSLDIPVRGVRIFFNHREGKSTKRSGHAFAEVYERGDWLHADPTWTRWDDRDAYLRSQSGLYNLRASIETSPGSDEYDSRTTLKYAVGLAAPTRGDVLYLDLEKGPRLKERLYVANNAENIAIPLLQESKPKASRVRLEVGDAGPLKANRPRLRGNQELDPGERDFATLQIEVPGHVADEVPAGGARSYPITIELSYEDGEKRRITKSYPLEIRIIRGPEVFDPEQVLASRFAPVLQMHHDETIVPKDVRVIVENAAL